MAELFGRGTVLVVRGPALSWFWLLVLLLLSECRGQGKPDRRVNAVAYDRVVPKASTDSLERAAGGTDARIAISSTKPNQVTIPAGEVHPPLVLVLHALGGSGEQIERDLELARFAQQRRFAYSAPDGSIDAQGRRVWNAGMCCNFLNPETDDVGRLIGIINDAVRTFGVDARRVFVIGYSNGGFMAHRLACEHSGSIRGIVSMAAAGPGSVQPCAPANAVAVLELHGDRDIGVPYSGGHLFGRSDLPSTPNVEKSLDPWARINRCQGPLLFKRRIDLITTLPGEETLVGSYDSCAAAPISLWKVVGGQHSLGLDARAFGAIWQFLVDLG